MVKVIKEFRDKKTGTVYNVNSIYKGDEKRIKELIDLDFLAAPASSDPPQLPPPPPEKNPVFPAHTGGGWYELSNGEKVQGKEEAEAAEKALSEGGE